MKLSCSANDCTKTVVAKGLCQSHYDRLRRYGNTDTRPTEAICVDCNTVFQLRLTGSLPKRCNVCSYKAHVERTRKDRWRKGLREGYDITPDDYQAMFTAQNGLCAICHKPPVGRGIINNRLSVDHDHATGKVRALLCSKCNTALGLMHDDTTLLANAIDYLNHHSKGN